jgi:hypothetical protein
MKAALAYFNHAIEENPKICSGLFWLSRHHPLWEDWHYAVMTPKEAFLKAKAAVKTLELDNALGEAHNSLAFVWEGFDWDFDSAD